MVTPKGIVVGADGLTVTGVGCGLQGQPRTSTARKIFLLKHRLVLASRNAEGVKAKDGRTKLYDFPTWTKVINQKLDSGATVEVLARLVEDESPKAFSFLFSDLMAPMCWNNDNAFCHDEPFVQYVIAGYELGVPVVYSVNLTVNCEKLSIKATPRVLIEPPKGQHVDARADGFGAAWLVFKLQICATDGDAYKRAIAEFPNQRNAFCAGDFKKVTLKQASDMLRILLQLDSEIYPSFVGFPLTIIILPKEGRGRVSTYSKPFPRLPDSRHQKSQQKEQ